MTLNKEIDWSRSLVEALVGSSKTVDKVCDSSALV